MAGLCRQPLLAVAAVAALQGCGILGLGEQEQPGVIQYHGDTTVVYLPALVSVDSAFAVRLHTFGGGCVTAGRTAVEIDGRTATIRPIDMDSGADICTDELRFLQHEAQVRFLAPGPATVVVQGGSQPNGGTLQLRFPLVVEEP
jgi:uncharacterized Zn-binding protein involved in type VI secretion